MREIKAVLFDLDETLTDAPAGLEAAHRAVARKLHDYLRGRGVEVDGATVRSKLDAFDDRMNLETKYDRDEWWPALLAELGFRQEVPPEILKELTKLYWYTFADANKPYADAEATLSHLRSKGYKLGLVTDTDGTKGMKRRRLKRLGLVKFFDVVVIGGEDTLRTKPSPEPFQLAASKLGLRPKECVVVGDKPFTDIKGAKAAGMRTILVKRRDWGIGERADFTINSLAELPSVLGKSE